MLENKSYDLETRNKKKYTVSYCINVILKFCLTASIRYECVKTGIDVLKLLS